ncbi:MAG TPA: DUF4870 domain-containing protein [Chloroflexi bacterium]|nr:DUF4870 domain-containing protein [Chloroflexota bacterium]
MAEEILQAPTEITDDDKLWALLSWLFWPIAIIVLLLEDKKQRPFIKYNAVQSLALAIVGWIISAILTFVLVGCVVGVAWLVYAIYLAIKAYQGEWVTVPFLTDFCKNQGWI